jgi:N-acetylmuramoyl-L-alanine amidase CwlA
MLDQVYTGYQLSNDQNIVWIVVHETGIATLGAYATNFSNTQINRSLNGFGGDATASWHYTVDGHQIVQNFEDNQHLYHAGDGAESIFYGGNANGIGIEMCMNADGNAETAMRNNAKLIAMLLHKYNLTLANVKQHFDFSNYQKNCPQNIRKNHRWYEFLGYIANEYRAQELLSGKQITYTISENEYAGLWKFEATGQTFNLNMLNVYKAPETDTEITITIHYNGQDYPVKTIIKAN